MASGAPRPGSTRCSRMSSVWPSHLKCLIQLIGRCCRLAVELVPIERYMRHAVAMSEEVAPWVRSRGLERLLAQETNVSDLIQFLSDRDPSPWMSLVGFVPDDVTREATGANRADLLLKSDSKVAVVEVKLGHLMTVEQQKKYEALAPDFDLYLAALSADEGRLADCKRWRFLSLSDLVGGWESASDELARVLASEVSKLLQKWDQLIFRVFEPSGSDASLSTLNQKFLARVVTRRIKQDLRDRGRLSFAGVTSGGGLPVVQAWTPVRDEGEDRAFIAEIRWWETKPGGELRFGVDFDPRPGHEEDEEVRRAAYELARSMEADIDCAALQGNVAKERPDLAELLRRDKPSRPKPKGDWEQVMVHGFKGSPLKDGCRNNRRRTAPGFYGDGALRFQAIVEVDFERASAHDLIELMDFTLEYLSSRQPAADLSNEQSQKIGS